MKTFLIGDGQVDETILANDMEEAKSLAADWIREGSWDCKCEIDVQVAEIDADKEVVDREWITVEVGEDPPEPECYADEHDWQTPWRLLGGLRENPGVWSKGGTTMVYRSVCKNCGCYRTETDYGCQRNPGQPTRSVEYDKADFASTEWIDRKDKSTQEVLSDIWDHNGFGDVDDWRSLDRAGLVEECADLLEHWEMMGWDLGSAMTAEDVADFLGKEWGR